MKSFVILARKFTVWELYFKNIVYILFWSIETERKGGRLKEIEEKIRKVRDIQGNLEAGGDILSVPKFTANLYCMCLSIPQICTACA